MKIVRKKTKSTRQAGVTLLEALIGIGIISLLTLSLYMSFMNAARNMGDAKQRSGAVALAQEKMEIIRSLAYEYVGTVSGLGPRGPIQNNEYVLKNGFRYQVNTDIRYKDDSFDAVAPTDTVPTDYKQARVRVSWQNGGYTKQIDFFSNFIPRGVETNVGGGTLSINTINSLGQIVPTVDVTIDSVEDNPEVDLTVQSDDTGNVTFPGTFAQHYRITLAKTGYETVQTYPNPPGSSFVPINPDMLITMGSFNMKTFTMDKVSDLVIRATDLADNSGIPAISFQLQGGKQIGTDPDTYTLSATINTDSSGEIEKVDISPGVYEILNLSTLGNAQYQYLGCDTGLPINLSADTTQTVNFIFADKTINSLVVEVANDADDIPIEGAAVHVTGTDFDQTVTTGVDGLAYFPQSSDPPVTMQQFASYAVDVTASGYDSSSDAVEISQMVVLPVDLTLTPVP